MTKKSVKKSAKTSKKIASETSNDKASEKKDYGLNINQKEFCELYVSKDFFGNGVESYIEAYNIDVTQKGAYDGARVNASKLLTKANILEYINTLLDSRGLNNEFVDKQLLLLITQNADFPSKVSAIKEFNKLKSRIQTKIDLTTKGESINKAPDLSKLSKAELLELKRINAKLGY